MEIGKIYGPLISKTHKCCLMGRIAASAFDAFLPEYTMYATILAIFVATAAIFLDFKKPEQADAIDETKKTLTKSVSSMTSAEPEVNPETNKININNLVYVPAEEPPIVEEISQWWVHYSEHTHWKAGPLWGGVVMAG